MIQKKKDHWKNTVFRLFGTSVIELDKKILLERSDYVIYNSIIDAYGAFSGKIIYNAKDDKDKKKLNKSIGRLTNLNEIRFNNKISLKKYMISAVTKKIPQVNKLQSGGVWGKNEADTFSVWQDRDIETSLGLVKFNEPPIGRSSNAKIFMGILQGRGPNKNLDIAVKLQKNNIDAVNEGDISMELSGLTGIPKYFTHGVCGPEEKLYYIVMERLGQTFGSYDKVIGSTFGNNERHNLKMLVGNYSIQLINGIESLYMHHYYHFDITTSNILFGI
jgi:hypothetical protein